MRCPASLLTMLLLFAIGCGAAAADNRHSIAVGMDKKPVSLISNVVFAQVPMRGYANVALRMDILRPESKEPLPAVLFITGGGFINANKDSFIQQRVVMAEAGYVVASMEYRVAPTVLFPAPLEDVKSAIRFMRASAQKFGIDPKRIAVFGASAGGYLSSFAGTSNGEKKFDVGDYLDQSSEVQAVIDFYGLSDLTRVGEGYSEEVQKLHMSPGATEAIWVNGASPFYPGGSIADFPDKAEAANPIAYAKADAPPFLIMHGDKDMLVSPRQTERIHEALVAKGVDSTYYVVQGAGHGGGMWAQPGIMDIVVAFLDAKLKK